jgi:glutathione S-transferase
MLELYHNINSVCAQKVRIALKEKGQEAKEHLLKLRGAQSEPAYMKLNLNGVGCRRWFMTKSPSWNPR